MSGDGTDTVAEIVRLYRDEGLPVSVVARKTGASRQVVRATVIREGVQRQRRMNATAAAAIIKACSAGMPVAQAAAVYGQTPMTASRLIARRGVTPQPGGELIRSAEAARITGYSADYLSRLARQGRVRTARGTERGNHLYYRDEIAALVPGDLVTGTGP